jgi:glycosyl transferase family 25
MNILNELSNKCYWINSRTRNDRFMQFSRRMAKEHLLCERFEAIIGNNVHNPDVDFSQIKSKLNREMNGGEKGCYLSHRELWKRQIKLGYKKMLVFEDDAVLLPNYKEVLAKIDFDFDILFLGQNHYGEFGYGEMSALIDIDKKPFYRTKGSWLTHAYIIDIKAAEMLLKHTEKAHTVVDGMIADFCSQMNAYAIAPAICIQDPKSKSSLR